MAQRNFYNQLTHDSVVRASRDTYSELANQGYMISINPAQEHNQYVGGANKLYPDLIVWRPNANDRSTGTAIIIEEVETEDSVNEIEAQQWVAYGKLNISQFRLIVPTQKAADALRIVQQYNIKVTEIWHYSSVGGKIYFNKYITL